MAEGGRRRTAAISVPIIIVAILALVALWRIGAPQPGEPGAAGTIGLNPDRTATLESAEVRQLTSDRTFWAGVQDDDPVFVVTEQALKLEPGAHVTIIGRVEAAPETEVARQKWGIDETTARAVHERGVYVRASRITPR